MTTLSTAPGYYEAPRYAWQDLSNVSCAALSSRLSACDIGGYADGQVQLDTYLPDSLSLTNDMLATYPNTSAWPNCSAQVQAAFNAGRDAGKQVVALDKRGFYFIDPATAILIYSGTGFIGPVTQPFQLTYTTVGGVLKQQISNGSLVFIVDCRSVNRNTPWLAQQAGTSVTGLQVAGFGLIEDAANMNVTAYPTITGAPTDHAPIIVTDHKHDSQGNITTQAKAGNTYLQAHIVGVMQSVYRGDPLVSEEPWAASISSGNVTGLSLTEVYLTGFALKRSLGTCRNTAGGVGLIVRIKDNPVFWTAITQPQSGGLTNYALLKWKSSNCHVMEMWHRAVGFDIEVDARNARYGVQMQAGYSALGPTYATPTLNASVPVGTIVSGTDTNVFRSTVVGNYTTQPVASGANYNPATKLFTDPGSMLVWEYLCPQQDTGKYNAGRIKVTGERIITHIRVEHSAYMHRVQVEAGGHSMDFYNINEMGSTYEVRTDGRVAGAIDKAIYTAVVVGSDYAINDKASYTPVLTVVGQAYSAGDQALDATGSPWTVTVGGVSSIIPSVSSPNYNSTTGVYTDPSSALRWLKGGNITSVFSATRAGTATIVPTPSGPNYNSTTKVFTDPGSTLVWVFRNGGFKAVGDQPFAVVYYTGVLQESPRRVFSGSTYDGHLYHQFDRFSCSIWAQPKLNHADAAFSNPSPSTVLVHTNSNANASGNSKRVYDVANPQNLVVGTNRYYGQVIPVDGNGAPTGVFPTAIGGNLLDTFWTGKNCLAFSAGTAMGDDGDDDG